MNLLSQEDVSAFIGESYLGYLLLGGLLLVMHSYRNVKLPAAKAFRIIAIILLFMCLASSLERWAIMSYDRLNVRIFASVVHYIIQPLVIYMELLVLSPPQTGRNRRGFLLTLPLIINTLIYLAAPFAGHLVFWYGEDYSFHRGPLGLSIYIVTFFYMALLVLWSVRVFNQSDKRLSTLLIFVVGIALLTGTLEALNIIPGYIDEAFVLGVLLFYLYLITLYDTQLRTDLIQKELELSRNELTLLRRQIKPHFVFNSLHNIKSLIRKDPDKAVQILEDFSEYLRANLDTLNAEGLVSFEDELDNIQAYLSLALVDGSRDIQVQYDIKERYFRLPPLTVEPLVENAIKHGLADGGTVTIATEKIKEGYVVQVSDDGCGFSAEQIAGSGDGSGVGIENVRTRLNKLCGGTLT